MTRRARWIVGGALTVATAPAVPRPPTPAGRTDLPASHDSSRAYTSLAGSDADPEETAAPVAGDQLTRASSAALAHTGGGRVTETEVGDEEGFYLDGPRGIRAL